MTKQVREKYDTLMFCSQTMNPDVYRGIWGGANCRDSVAQTPAIM